MPFQETQLEFIRFLQSLHSNTLDQFFRFMNYFDTEYFIFLLFPIIWIGFSWKWGIRIFYIQILSSFLNAYFKYLFLLPRPYFIDPSVALVKVSGYGFPSGGAQTSLLLGLILLYYWKSPYRWVVGIPYIILVSFSRIFLGVHFPLDVLGGWILGLLLFLAFVYIRPHLEYLLFNKPFLGLLLSLLLPLAAILLFPHSKTYYLMASALAVGVGSFFSIRYRLFLPSPSHIWQGLLRAFIAILGTFLLFLLAKTLLPFKTAFSLSLVIQSLLLSLWISLAASPVCRLFIK